MNHIGILSNPTQDGIGQSVEHLAGQFADRGVSVLLADDLQSICTSRAWEFCSHAHLAEQSDVVVAMGGDGTILRAAALAQDSITPILGVNLGRLGFLAGAEPSELEGGLDCLLAGEYTIETRMALTAQVGEKHIFALNEVVLERAVSARMVQVKTWIGDATVSSFWGNGLILATPTGSTSYSLSTGGPIVHPEMDALILTPISPHSLTLRPLVVPGDQTVAVQISAAHSEIVLSADGRTVEEMHPKERVLVRKAPQPVRLINLQGHSFYEVLRRKLDWSLDRRL
ncbi:MAG: ATP-NAD kinase [Candidatus Latescibacteria bacterium]|jgi:NAD+ kinase|nr:ATP-NAD kinase [Candidatus Latescibacterota bacterium]MBT4137506.1 ATP-NAD kinase [Candidatus Latescibacterota bacterium]